MRVVLGAVMLAALCGTADVARADEPTAAVTTSDTSGDPAFVYTRAKAGDSDYVRAAFEQMIILGVGFVQYTTTPGNKNDWDVGTDWTGFRGKLLFGAASFDDNHFDTNWLTHPLAGFFYYSAARSNRLGVLPSFAITTGSSILWEVVGEIREQIAINDVIVTPGTALPLGENALQIGAFLHRGRRTPALIALGWLFAPLKSAHDVLDGVEPEPAESFDDLGLPADVWHRFSASAFGGVTAQQGAPTHSDFGGTLRSELVTLPRYRQAGRGTEVFDSGEVTSLRVNLAMSEGLVRDFDLTATAVPAGIYWHDVTVDRDGSLRGSEVLAGLNLTAQYTNHTYDLDGRHATDRLALVGAGATLEDTVHVGSATLRARVDMLGDFAGVDAYALPEYRKARGDVGLTSVLNKERYYHAYGATIRPLLELSIGRFDCGAEGRLDGFQAISNVDVDGAVADEVTPVDRRTAGRAWVGVRPLRHLRFFVDGERNERWGRVSSARASRSEVAAHGGMELVF